MGCTGHSTAVVRFTGGIPGEAEAVFIQVRQGRALGPPGILRELNRWQRQLATDADGWLGATAGVTEDGWSVVVMHFDSEQQARRHSNRPEQHARVRGGAPAPGR